MEPIDMPQETTIELDVPNENEHQYETLFGSNTGIEEEIVFLPHTIFNQGLKPETRMACSRYGIIHAINAQNIAVSKVDGMRTYEYNPEVMWENFLKIVPSAEREGATLQSALEQMVQLSLITGYSRLNSQEDMKASLRAFRPIYTGSKQCNWATVRDEHRYSLGTGSAHIFCIVGYNQSGWIAINSYGSTNGVFHIPYELTYSLFSCYSLSDTRDSAIFATLK